MTTYLIIMDEAERLSQSPFGGYFPIEGELNCSVQALPAMYRILPANLAVKRLRKRSADSGVRKFLKTKKGHAWIYSKFAVVLSNSGVFSEKYSCEGDCNFCKGFQAYTPDSYRPRLDMKFWHSVQCICKNCLRNDDIFMGPLGS